MNRFSQGCGLGLDGFGIEAEADNSTYGLYGAMWRAWSPFIDRWFVVIFGANKLRRDLFNHYMSLFCLLSVLLNSSDSNLLYYSLNLVTFLRESEKLLIAEQPTGRPRSGLGLDWDSIEAATLDLATFDWVETKSGRIMLWLPLLHCWSIEVLKPMFHKVVKQSVLDMAIYLAIMLLHLSCRM